MIRSFCILLSLVLILALFSGCSGDPPETVTPSTAPAVSETIFPPEATLPPAIPDPALEDLRQNLPVMDGSTSLIPLEAGIRAALFGKSMEEATKDVSHTTSWESFYNLMEGTVDLIFSVPLSAEQQRLADEQGIGLEAVPIAMEGFVFVVNADNPVDTLTQAQLRGIYSGAITNWSEVGGLDEAIIPYQRNYDSGSQNYMRSFMGDTPLMDAPTELRPGSMFGLMDVIAVSDNSRASIGYSVYAYAADMYGNGDEIKFIQVDGVAPSKQTFADGTYPLMGYNYAMFRSDEPGNSYVRQLVDWMLTEDGQRAIAGAGYVTVSDIGYNYPEKTVEKYQGIGLGTPAAAPASSEYALVEIFREQTDWGEYTQIFEELNLTETTTADGLPTWHITKLADQALQAEINAWIDSQMEWVNGSEYDDMVALVEQLNRNYSWGGLYAIYDRPPCTVTAKNGYLSVAVFLRYWKNGNDEHHKFYRTETAVWDLLTGKRLTPQELFCQGVDIDALLNAYIQEYTQIPRGEFLSTPDMIQDFVALPESGWHLTHEGLYIDYGNPDFLNGEYIPLDQLPDGVLVSEQPRDFSSALIGENTFSVLRFRMNTRDIRYGYASDGQISCGFLAESVSPHAAAINAQVLEHLDTWFTEDTVRDYFSDHAGENYELDLWWMDWNISIWGNRYAFFSGSRPEAYLPEENRFLSYPYDCALLFDLRTGQQLHWQELFRDGWEATVEWEEDRVPAAGVNANVEWYQLSNGDRLTVCFREGSDYYYCWIPAEYILY